MRLMRALAWSAVFFLLVTGAALAAVEIYPVTEVKRGTVGVGYTVVEGTTIEPFSVEVLGVMEKAGPTGSLILVRTSGNLIDRVGGIASGMSGSPVYIDGKLLGAIGYGFEFADHRIGLVTPAADMLAVMDLIQPADVVIAGSDSAGEGVGEGEAEEGRTALPSGVVLADSASQAQHLATTLPPEVWVAAPVSTPLVVNGLGPRAMDRLENLFANYNVMPMQGGSPLGVDTSDVSLAPGASLGVQLVRGDVEVAAIGTVTAVDGDRFIAFGHPFLNRGEVDHFATGAYIFHTASSMSFPFKIGAPTEPIGRLLQDRGAAIAGVLGEKPDTVAMSVQVSDRDRGVEERFEVDVARDKELTVPLIIVSALEAVDRALDRLGPGTSRVSFRIDGDGMPRALERENVFYSSSDIAAASLSELWIGLDLLQGNEFQDPALDEVVVAIEVEGDRQTARIERAEPSVRRVRQGETVDVVVTLRPFRAPAFDVTIPLEIPTDIARGPVIVSVRGGIFGGYAPLPVTDGVLASTDEEGEGDSVLSIEAESLEKMIDEFEREPRNNEVIVEFYPSSFFGGNREFLRSDDDGGESDEDESIDEALTSDEDADRGESEASDGAGEAEVSAAVDEVAEVAAADETAEIAAVEGSLGDGEEAAPEVESDEAGNGAAEDEAEYLDEDEEASETGSSEYLPVRAIYSTDYVVHGETQFTLTIIPSRERGQDDEATGSDNMPPQPSPAEPWHDQTVHPMNAQ